MENKNRQVAILMSTYNGERYISSQLDSIINQTHTNFRLYIRDDGSIDNTIQIINDYVNRDSRIVLVNDSIKHRGVKNSFLWLLEQVECEYYMFCDQDDVWLPKKISESLKYITQSKVSQPTVVCTDLFLVNQDLDIINKSMWETHHIRKLVNNKDGLKIASMFPGCTMLFNHMAKEIALSETFEFPLHDMQISLTTYKHNGVIIPIHSSLIKYRQHSNNVVGLYSGNKWVLNKLANIKTTVIQMIKYYNIVHDYLSVSLLKYIILKIQHLFNRI